MSLSAAHNSICKSRSSIPIAVGNTLAKNSFFTSNKMTPIRSSLYTIPLSTMVWLSTWTTPSWRRCRWCCTQVASWGSSGVRLHTMPSVWRITLWPRHLMAWLHLRPQLARSQIWGAYMSGDAVFGSEMRHQKSWADTLRRGSGSVLTVNQKVTRSIGQRNVLFQSNGTPTLTCLVNSQSLTHHHPSWLDGPWFFDEMVMTEK